MGHVTSGWAVGRAGKPIRSRAGKRIRAGLKLQTKLNPHPVLKAHNRPLVARQCGPNPIKERHMAHMAIDTHMDMQGTL